MQPDVRYCTTTDGAAIAYTVAGSGPPFVCLLDPVVSHAALEWTNPVNGPALKEEARYFTLIRLDLRGTGLSGRVPPATLDQNVLDVEAVVDRLQLERFTLHANSTSTYTALNYAARHPDRVARLIIVDGYLRASDLLAASQVKALVAAAENDWELATETIGAMVFGPGREESRAHGDYIRNCIDLDFFKWSITSFDDSDATPLAKQIKCPVLVIRHTGIRWLTDEMTRDLVATFPDSRLVTIPGTWADDAPGLIHRMAAFVYEEEGLFLDRPRSANLPAGGVRTILFTDLVGHTEMMRRLGDVAGRGLLREHERITREAIAAHAGTEIKTDGDSFMVSFASVSSAVDCAIAIQRGLEGRQSQNVEPLSLRMGLHVGEPIEDDGDLYGEAVILAARIASHAAGGEILVSETVRQLLAGKGHAFTSQRAFTPKGFDHEVTVSAVDWTN